MKNGVCCFCGKNVELGELDPCTLSIANNGEFQQSWPCHAECYRERLGDLPYASEMFDRLSD